MLLTLAQLRDWLTEEIRAHPGCEEVQVLGLFRLERADRDGCNWSYTLVLDTGGAPAPVYALAYAKVLARGRARFNVK